MRNIFFLILLISQINYGQENDFAKFDTNDLIGIWHLKPSLKNEKLVFKRIVDDEIKYGSKISILKDNIFANEYLAPCLNDRKIFTHNYMGKWNLNKKGLILTTSVPIDKKGSIYKIVYLKHNNLILEEIKTK